MKLASNNLPIPLTSLVGREREIAELMQQLPATRLLTLTGAGGSGKTRLALELATAAAPDFASRACWVELAALSDPALVPQAVASALGLREQPGQSVTGTVISHLHSRRLLLVLDNCEHLVEPCAQLAEPLLRSCPGLTAREVEVLRLVAEGLTDALIAEQLVVSRRTVNAHLRSIYAKIGAGSRSEASRYALEHGLA